jgi:hypothetical protein
MLIQNNSGDVIVRLLETCHTVFFFSVAVSLSSAYRLILVCQEFMF